MIHSDGVHLVGDSENELHRFAKKVGLKRGWFQGKGRYPHYDILSKKILWRVVCEGIEICSGKDLIRKIKGV